MHVVANRLVTFWPISTSVDPSSKTVRVKNMTSILFIDLTFLQGGLVGHVMSSRYSKY